MKIRVAATAPASASKELLVAFAHDGGTPDLGKPLAAFVATCAATGDLSTKERATSLFYPSGRGVPKRVAFVGTGKPAEITTEKLRRAAAVAQRKAAALEVKGFRLRVGAKDHEGMDADVAGRAVAEGLILGAYEYQKPSGKKPKPGPARSADVEYTGKDLAGFKAGVRLGTIGAQATVFARDLENLPGNLCTPTVLAREAKKLKAKGLAVRVLEESDMARLKMHALLGVSRGSKQPAKLIVLDYKPAGFKKTVCVVGKGLTFDSGGISLKPGAKMDEMRYDMCGGGAVLGLYHAIAHGGLSGVRGKVRIVGLVPSSENMPDADAQKPGDVVAACDGTTIEILNTDAEGRLILADAMAWAKKTFAPDLMVDLATLTGAVVVALGHEVAGIMGSDEELIDDLIEAGQACDEPLWQLPMWEVHKEQLKSKFADVANLNSPSHGNGSTSGGAFLSYFTEGVKWAHIDIAGAAWGGVAKDYYTGGAAGTAVRTLLHWARSL